MGHNNVILGLQIRVGGYVLNHFHFLLIPWSSRANNIYFSHSKFKYSIDSYFSVLNVYFPHTTMSYVSRFPYIWLFSIIIRDLIFVESYDGYCNNFLFDLSLNDDSLSTISFFFYLLMLLFDLRLDRLSFLALISLRLPIGLIFVCWIFPIIFILHSSFVSLLFLFLLPFYSWYDISLVIFFYFQYFWVKILNLLSSEKLLFGPFYLCDFRLTLWEFTEWKIVTNAELSFWFAYYLFQSLYFQALLNIYHFPLCVKKI